MAVNLLPLRNDGNLVPGDPADVIVTLPTALADGLVPLLTVGALADVAATVDDTRTLLSWRLTVAQVTTALSVKDAGAVPFRIVIGAGDDLVPLVVGHLLVRSKWEGRPAYQALTAEVSAAAIAQAAANAAEAAQAAAEVAAAAAAGTSDSGIAALVNDPASAVRASLSSTYVTAPGSSPSIPSYGFTASNTERWRVALKAVRLGTGHAKVLCIGDSTTYGVGATPGSTSWPAVLASLMNTNYAPTTRGLAIPPFSGGTTADPRWSAQAGWGLSAQGWASGAAYQGVSGAAQALNFAPHVAADTYDVYYIRNGGFGSITCKVNGATASSGGTWSTAGASGVQKQTVTAPYSADPLLSFTVDAVGQVFILGVDSYVAATKTIRIGGAGVSNSTTDLWRTDVSYVSLNSVRAYAPDLTFIMLGINDALAYSTAQVQTYLSSIITAAQVSGDVCLLSVIPSRSPDRDPSIEDGYRVMTKALAVAKGCSFIDIFARFGDYATANGRGFMYDGIHANPAGYADIAAAVQAALMTV